MRKYIIAIIFSAAAFAQTSTGNGVGGLPPEVNKMDAQIETLKAENAKLRVWVEWAKQQINILSLALRNGPDPGLPPVPAPAPEPKK
jgi:hypothetical protein